MGRYLLVVLALLCGCMGASEVTTTTTTSQPTSTTTFTLPEGVPCGPRICAEGEFCLNAEYGICGPAITTTTTLPQSTSSTTTTSTSTTATTLSDFERIFQRTSDKYYATTSTTSTTSTTAWSYTTTTIIEGITPPYEPDYTIGDRGVYGGRLD